MSLICGPPRFLELGLDWTTHEFRLCSWLWPWQPVAGLYAFVAWPAQRVLYIGETRNFALRMPMHEVWLEAWLYGATDVYAMGFAGNDDERRIIERALIAAYNPLFNTRHRTALANGTAEPVFCN